MKKILNQSNQGLAELKRVGGLKIPENSTCVITPKRGKATAGWMPAVILLLAVLLLLYCGPAKAESIVVATGEYPPYVSMKMERIGLWHRICFEAFKAVDISMKVKYLPWSRALKATGAGKFVATMAWLRSKERATLFLFSQPITDSNYYFFYNCESSFNWHDFSDLKGLRIGATKCYSYSKEFLDFIASGQAEVQWSSSDLSSLKKLARGRIDICPINQNVGAYLLARVLKPEMARQISYHPRPLIRASSYVLFSRKHPDGKRMLTLFNRGMDIIAGNGTLHKIMRKYSKLYLKAEPVIE